MAEMTICVECKHCEPPPRWGGAFCHKYRHPDLQLKPLVHPVTGEQMTTERYCAGINLFGRCDYYEAKTNRR